MSAKTTTQKLVTATRTVIETKTVLVEVASDTTDESICAAATLLPVTWREREPNRSEGPWIAKVETITTPCAKCWGSGEYSSGNECYACNGEGRVSTRKP